LAVIVGGTLVQLGPEACKAAAATPAATPYGYDVKISFSPEAVERMKSLHRQVTLANQFYGDASPEAIARLKLKPYAQLEMGVETIPVDVVELLKELAPARGLPGYQTLLKYYISEGLRRDEAQAELQTLRRLTEALKKRGVKESVLKEALAEARSRSGDPK